MSIGLEAQVTQRTLSSEKIQVELRHLSKENDRHVESTIHVQQWVISTFRTGMSIVVVVLFVLSPRLPDVTTVDGLDQKDDRHVGECRRRTARCLYFRAFREMVFEQRVS